MRKYERSEVELELLLRQMPHFKDKRSKEQLYRRISFSVARKKRKIMIVPMFASAAAILLVAVLGTTYYFTGNHHITMDKSESKAVENSQDISAADLKTFHDEEHSEESAIPSLVVSNSQLQDQDVVVWAIPDKNVSMVIPVSVLVNRDGKSTTEQLEMSKALLTEEEWGLSENPFNTVTISLSKEEGKWEVNVSSKHSMFSGGSKMEELFTKGLEEMMYWANVDSASLYTDGKPGINLSHIGMMHEISSTKLDEQKSKEKRRAYLLYQYDKSRPVFLTPTPDSYGHFEEAIDSMNDEQEEPLKPSIPEGIFIQSVKTEGDHVFIQFSDDSHLRDEPVTKWMIEAILLTAKEFGFKEVTFVSKKAERIGDYPFNEKIVVPVSPNPMPVRIMGH